MAYWIKFLYPGPTDNTTRPAGDRMALLSEFLHETAFPHLCELFDLRDDQLAEVLYDLGCWYADVEVSGPGAGRCGKGVR